MSVAETGGLLVLTAINLIGVKSGVRAAVFLAVTKTLPLLLFIAVGIFYATWSQAKSNAIPAGADWREAALLLLFAYAGFENTAAPAGEVKNPRRDVPFANGRGGIADCTGHLDE
jgi:amino acid transporter